MPSGKARNFQIIKHGFLFVWQFFAPFTYLLSHLTISSEKKPSSIPIALLGNLLSCVSNFTTYRLGPPNSWRRQLHQAFCYYVTRIPISLVSNTVFFTASSVLKVQVSITSLFKVNRVLHHTPQNSPSLCSLPSSKATLTFQGFVIAAPHFQKPRPVFVFSCCVTNCNKFNRLKHTHIYYLTVSTDQWSGQVLTGCSAQSLRLQWKCQRDLILIWRLSWKRIAF